VHAGGAGIPGDGGNDVFRLAPPQNQLTAVLAQRGVQIEQAPVQERQPWSSRRPTQRIVEYEERDYPPRVGSSGQRRMVLRLQSRRNHITEVARPGTWPVCRSPCLS
jgi:hypothetical protein